MGKFVCLEKSTLTKEWTLEERAALAHFLTLKVVPKGAVIEEARSKTRCLYFVESGTVLVKFESVEVILKEGESFGELSLSQPSVKLCHIMAHESSGSDEGVRLWCLEGPQWIKLKTAAPVVAEKLSSAISTKIAQLLNSSPPPPRMFRT